jgi:hypothetical protein
MPGACLFRPVQLFPHHYDRIGDLLVIAQEGSSLWWADKENFLIGQHGSLTSDEMLVPLLMIHL